jgi:hypothetical protein
LNTEPVFTKKPDKILLNKVMGKSIKISLVLIIILASVTQNLKAQDEILFRRHLINSGINGFFYGLALDYIVDAEGGAAAGLPIIVAGTSVLVPVLTNSSKTISPNSLILSSHGKFVGWAHGFALATLIGGENAWEEPSDKLTVALGALTSISLGIVGNQLGKTKDWTEGQTSMYRLYGWTMPLTGTLMMGSFSDSPRAIAAGDLLFAAGGYLLADKVYKNYQYTRGDARAIQVFTLLNGGLGFGIFADLENRSSVSQSALLIPAAGVAAGSVVGQLWLKNINLTPKQGLNIAYATTGGAIFGLGISLLMNSEEITPYYVVPYLTGLGAYAAMVETMRQKNKTTGYIKDNKKSNWDIALMPQNIVVNNRITGKGFMVNGRLTGMQPLFAASVRF